VWNQWLVGATQWSGQVHEAFGTLTSEWQNFVSRRLKEDFEFTQRIAQCRTPDQVWSAHADFWQKAIEDYRKEYLLMGKLAGSLPSKAVAAAQCAGMEVGALSKAA
jgi:hypothetical protein